MHFTFHLVFATLHTRPARWRLGRAARAPRMCASHAAWRNAEGSGRCPHAMPSLLVLSPTFCLRRRGQVEREHLAWPAALRHDDLRKVG